MGKQSIHVYIIVTMRQFIIVWLHVAKNEMLKIGMRYTINVQIFNKDDKHITVLLDLFCDFICVFIDE